MRQTRAIPLAWTVRLLLAAAIASPVLVAGCARTETERVPSAHQGYRDPEIEASEDLIQAYAHYGQGVLLSLEARGLDVRKRREEASALRGLAARRFEQCLARDRNALEAARSLAVCALRLKDSQRALHALQTMVRLRPEDPQARRALGWTYANVSRYEDAVSEFRAALSYLGPADAKRNTCVLELAGILRRLKRDEEAAQLLEAELSSGRPDGEMHRLLAETLSALDRRERAIAVCRRWLDGHPDPQSGPDVRCLSLLGREYARSGEVDAGLKILRGYARRAPGNWRIVECIARVLADAGRADEAVAEAQRFVKAHPKQTPARLLLAELFETEKDFVAVARVLVETAERQREGSPSLKRFLAAKLLEAGDLCAQQGHDEAALSAYAAALRGERVLGHALRRGLRLRYAERLAAVRRYGQAIAALSPLLSGDKPDPDAHGLHIRCLWRDGQHAEAVRAARSSLKLFAGDAARSVEFHRQLSWFYVRLGRPGEGETELQRALRLEPSHPGANNDLGYLYAEQGRNLEEAVQHIRAALAARPEEPAFLDSLGWACYKMALRDDDPGKARSAHDYLSRAARARADSTILCHLGDVSFVLGMWQAARDAWSKSIEAKVDPDLESTRAMCRRKIDALRGRLPEGGPSTVPRPLAAPEKQLQVGTDRSASLGAEPGNHRPTTTHP